MYEDKRDLRTQLLEAFQSVESSTAWYLDREDRRVVWVRGKRVSDDDLSAKDVDEDEARFLEIPPILEADVHDWMTAFVEARGEAKVSALLDHKAGANARFLSRLEKREPAALQGWKVFRSAKTGEMVDAWLADVDAGRFDARPDAYPGADLASDALSEEE